MDPTAGAEGTGARRRKWGLGDWFLGLVVGLVAANVLATIVLLGQPEGHRHITLAVFAVSEVALWAGWIGVPLLASVRKGTGSPAEDFGLRVRTRDTWLGVAVGIGVQLLVVPLVEFPLRHQVDKHKGSAADLVKRSTGIELVVVAVAVVLLAPVVEELFFRGLLLRSLQGRMGDGAAIVVSAAVFAVLHFEVFQMPGLFVIGVVLAVLAIRYGRLGPGICAHAAFNAIAVAFLVR